jgi:hypothetical protein
MILLEIWIQMRRMAIGMGGATIVILASVVGTRIGGQVEMASAIVGMVAWCYLVCFGAYCVFRYLNGPCDYLLFGATRNPVRSGVLLCIAMMSWCLFAYVASSVIGLCWDWVDGGTGSAEVYLGGGLARIVSILCFGSVVMLVALGVNRIRSAGLSLFVAALVYVIPTITWIALLVERVTASGEFWALGVNNEFNGVVEYANVVPILVWGSDPGVTLGFSTIAMSVAVNLIVGVACWGTIALWSRKGKVDLVH